MEATSPQNQGPQDGRCPTLCQHSSVICRRCLSQAPTWVGVAQRWASPVQFSLSQDSPPSLGQRRAPFSLSCSVTSADAERLSRAPEAPSDPASWGRRACECKGMPLVLEEPGRDPNPAWQGAEPGERASQPQSRRPLNNPLSSISRRRNCPDYSLEISLKTLVGCPVC